MKRTTSTIFGQIEAVSIPPIMSTNIPQQVTARYVSNLAKKGRNHHFHLAALEQQEARNDDVVIGQFYVAAIRNTATSMIEQASGVTPHQAIYRALVKHGVTFRQ